LVVDSSKDMTSLLANVFSNVGACVTEANRGEDAMVFLNRGDFDVIFLDLTMPESDGWKALQFIRESHPYMLARTIVLTADRHDRQAADSLSDCRIACMFKPFLLVNLVSQASRAVSNVEPLEAAA
jgi:DNA-binding NtrC family response regulator